MRFIRSSSIAWLVAACTAALASTASGRINVSLSLNVLPTVATNPNGGGYWSLYAKTDSANGIAAIDAYIADINSAGITYGAGINAALDNGNPYVVYESNAPVNLLYFQDVSQGGIVPNVGKPAFSPGPDPLGDAAWINATKIAMGTYISTAPNFAPKNGVDTDANLFSTSTAPFNASVNATTTFAKRTGIRGDFNFDGNLDATDLDLLFATTQGAVTPARTKFDVNFNNVVNSVPNTTDSDADNWVHVIKDTEYGDANLDRKVDFGDLVLLAQNYNSPTGGWGQGSFDGVLGVGFGDLVLLAQHYNFVGSFEADWALAQSMVPEPNTLILVAVGVAAGLRRSRRVI